MIKRRRTIRVPPRRLAADPELKSLATSLKSYSGWLEKIRSRRRAGEMVFREAVPPPMADELTRMKKGPKAWTQIRVDNLKKFWQDSLKMEKDPNRRVLIREILGIIREAERELK